MNKSVFLILGFTLFIVGAITMILSLVGLRLQILAPLESLGAGYSFLIKLIMTLLGVIIVYLVKTLESEDNDDEIVL